MASRSAPSGPFTPRTWRASCGCAALPGARRRVKVQARRRRCEPTSTPSAPPPAPAVPSGGHAALGRRGRREPRGAALLGRFGAAQASGLVGEIRRTLEAVFRTEGHAVPDAGDGDGHGGNSHPPAPRPCTGDTAPAHALFEPHLVGAPLCSACHRCNSAPASSLGGLASEAEAISVAAAGLRPQPWWTALWRPIR
jgi:hypothetical protein